MEAKRNARRWVKVIFAAICAFVGLWHWVLPLDFNRPGNLQLLDSNNPTCRIRILTHEARLTPEVAWSQTVDPREIETPFPLEQVENPVLFQKRYARVQFENTTEKALAIFARAHISSEWENRELQKQQRETIQNTRGISAGVRNHLLSLLDIVPGYHPAAPCFVVETMISDAKDEVLHVVNHHRCVQLDKTIPSAAEIHANSYPVMKLQSGESIEFPFSILGAYIPRKELSNIP